MKRGQHVGIGHDPFEDRRKGVEHSGMEFKSSRLQVRSLKTADAVWAEAAEDDLIELTGEKKNCWAILGGIIEIHNYDVEGLLRLF